MLGQPATYVTRGIGLLVVVAIHVSACSKAPAADARASPVPSATAAPMAAPSGPIEVVIADDARTRAGIEVGLPVRRAMSATLRLPGRIAPDAYGQVTVLALAAGRVTAVPVELGTVVAEHDPLATMVSSDVADAQAMYISHRAAVEADHQRVTRLERLVAIGADTRQSLDDAKAMHASHTSELDRAVSRLKLLGFRATDIDQLGGTSAVTSDFVVRAPAAGVVTKREINPGQTVSAGAPLIEVSRLDRVWVLADAFAEDAGRIRVGLAADVVARGTPEQRWPSKIVYVNPQVDASTRTTEVRLELANANRVLRFGMLVDVDVAWPSTTDALTVPSEAVQSMGDSQVVYVQHPQRADVLVETLVSVGSTAAGRTEITRGLAGTDRVVTRGAAFVRAERLRTHPR